MAVGGRTRHCLGGDVARSTRPVLNDEWLAETLRQPLTNQAREDVRRAARGKADDDSHGPRRIGLRPCNSRDSRQRGRARCEMEKISAGKFHVEPPFTS